MGYFSQLDIERQQTNQHARHRGWIDDPGPTIDKPKRPDIGSVGVCLDDNGQPATLWQLTARAGNLGFFANIADPTQKCHFSFDDFWQLT